MGNLRLSPGSLFANRFEILRAAGSGGMGTVYCATDRYSGDTVALKLLHAEISSRDESDRFLREAQLLSELRHPGIVAHVAHGQTPDGQRYLAMEWLDGQELSERLARGPLPVRDGIRLLEQVADALSAAHRRGIIHRDLKPSNLFLVGGDIGRVKILDFGIARRIATAQAMTRTGMVIGTPEYMAPEQARGSRDLKPATDVFSLGCVLYECLIGQPPFVADHIAAVLIRILFEEPIPIAERRPGISQAFSDLIGRMLCKDPEQRLADAEALRAELLALGEQPEGALAVTLASPRTGAESFAEQEQSLFSIVLAAAPEADIGFGATQSGSDVQPATTDKRMLLQALSGLSSSPAFLADGTLAVTVTPLGSAHDQATVAARAALLIKERWPEAIVAMATGRGAVRGRTAVGEVVELAARSLHRGSQSAAAKPTSGVLIDPLSAKLLAGRFAQTPQSGGALLLHEERDVDMTRPLLGKPTPCVGREAELGTLESQLSACIEESEARVVLVTAPPGVGKSRLRHEFLRRIEKRDDAITVLVGRADMMSAAAPYAILRAVIHRLCGISHSDPLDTQRERLWTRIAEHLAPADSERTVLFIGELCSVPFPDEGKPVLQAARLDPKLMRDGLRRALLDFFAAECAAAPVLLVLDDLQWGDELTVSLLDEVLRQQAGAPLLVLSFARPEVHATFPKLWHGHRVNEILLKGLSKKACERLIVQVLGKDVPPQAIARAVEQCAGNALFLEELIRSFAEGSSEAQSETVIAMLQARLGRLDSNARRAVRAASVFGQTFWRGGIATLLGLEEEAAEAEHSLSTLVDAEVIQVHAQSRLTGQAEYGFRHALVREAAYSLLTDIDRQRGHRLAAEFLESAHERNLAIIAEHFVRGGESQRAAISYLRAAEDSLASGNLLGTLHLVEQGLKCAPDEALCAELKSRECYAAMALDRLDLAASTAEFAILRLPPGSLGWCRVIIGALVGAMSSQNMPRSFELIAQTLATEPHEDARATYSEVLTIIIIASIASVPGAFLQTLLAKLAANTARAEAHNPLVRRYLHSARSFLAMMREPRPWTCIQESLRTSAMSRQAGDPLIDVPARIIGSEWGWFEVGDFEGVERRLREHGAEIASCQSIVNVVHFRHLLARVLCERPDEKSWTEAEALILSIRKSEGGHSLYPVLARNVLARIAFLRGQFQGAETLSRALMQQFPADAVWLMNAASIQMRALLALGRPAEATQVAERVLGSFPMLGGSGVTEVEVRLAASEAFHHAGDFERARSELGETLRQIQLRADDITDPFWKNSYLTRNASCVRAQALVQEWGLSGGSLFLPATASI